MFVPQFKIYSSAVFCNKAINQSFVPNCKTFTGRNIYGTYTINCQMQVYNKLFVIVMSKDNIN